MCAYIYHNFIGDAIMVTCVLIIIYDDDDYCDKLNHR